jgi:hypothetical protein
MFAYLFGKNWKDLDLLTKVHTGGILRDIRAMGAASSRNRLQHYQLMAALSGDMVLAFDGTDEMDVSAATLNAAEAGTFKRTLSFVHLVAEQSNPPCPANMGHEWAMFQPVVTTAEVVVDADVDPPVVTGTPTFMQGGCFVEVTFDTDEGATKTYAEGDTCTVKVQTKADDTWLGFDVEPITFTFNVIA